MEMIGDAFGVDAAIVQGFTSLARLDKDGIAVLAGRLGVFESEKMDGVLKILNLTGPLVARATEQVGQVGESGADTAELDARKKLFQMVARDGTKTITTDEFTHLLKYYRVNLSEHKTLALFAQFDKNGNGELDFDETNKAIDHLESNISVDVLEILGFSHA